MTEVPIAIEETDVHGVKAYHAHCLACGWVCWHDKGHYGRHPRQSTAERHARRHVCPVRTELDVVLAPVFAFMAKARTYSDAVAIADTVRARLLREWEQL